MEGKAVNHRAVKTTPCASLVTPACASASLRLNILQNKLSYKRRVCHAHMTHVHAHVHFEALRARVRFYAGRCHAHMRLLTSLSRVNSGLCDVKRGPDLDALNMIGQVRHSTCSIRRSAEKSHPPSSSSSSAAVAAAARSRDHCASWSSWSSSRSRSSSRSSGS